MKSVRSIGLGAIVCAVALACLAMGPASAGAASTPGWRIVATGPAGNQNGWFTTIALSSNNAWIGGFTGATRTSWGKPLIRHWNGRAWSLAKLPAGLSGVIRYLRASGPDNVWAFGENVKPGAATATAFALRWNGRAWSLIRRWSGEATIIGAAAVFGPNDVWVFRADGDLIQHYTGGGHWSSSSIPGALSFSAASGLSSRDIWVVADGGGFPIVAHGGVGGWQISAFPNFALGQSDPPITGVYERTANDVWAIGGDLSASNHWYPNLAHWNGRAWSKVGVTGNFVLTTAVSDGHGGLWALTGWDSTGIPPHPVHFTGGRLKTVSLARVGGRYVGVYALAGIPGSQSVWGAGMLSGLGSLGQQTAVILKYGR